MLVLCLLVWGLVWAEDVKINTIGEKPADGSGVQAAGEGGDASAADKPNVNAPAKEFDAAAVAADADYYKKVDPSRAWQQAGAPAGKVRNEEVLIVGDPIRLTLANGQLDKPLEVKVKPGMPVTFVALDTGHFSNGEVSITVKADEKGHAQADFWVGGVGNYRVLAGSPENFGPAQFEIQAVTAEELKDIASGKYAADYLAQQAAGEQSRREAAEAVQRRIEAARAKAAAAGK